MFLRSALAFFLLATLAARDSKAAIVSNLNEPADFGADGLGVTISGGTFALANSFTTGGNPLGYSLEAVTLRLGNAEGPASGFTLELFTVAGGIPDSPLLTFTGNDDPAVAGEYTYTTPGFFLAPNTTFSWVASAPDSPSDSFYFIESTSSNSESGSDGWLIDDRGLFAFNGSWGPAASPAAYIFSVSATTIPEPSSLMLLSLVSAVAAGRSLLRRRPLR